MNAGLAAIFSGVWAMKPEMLEGFAQGLDLLLRSGGKIEGLSPDRGLRWANGGRTRSPKGASVAVLSLHGMIDHRRSFAMDVFGGTDTLGFADAFDSLVEDPNVKGIVFDVDSPGGSSAGVAELSRRIYDARDKKPIVAVSNMQMDSAAYWIGSSAHKVFVSPSSETGSIGVWSAAAEYSKQLEQDGVRTQVWRASESPNKAPFLPWSEFTQEAIADEQVNVDRVYNEFRSAVARNRGVTENAVQKGFGQGKVFDAQAAVAAGLADRVATLETVVSRMNSGKLTLASMSNLDEVFSDAPEPDESWRDYNAMEAKRSELRRKGVLS